MGLTACVHDMLLLMVFQDGPACRTLPGHVMLTVFSIPTLAWPVPLQLLVSSLGYLSPSVCCDCIQGRECSVGLCVNAMVVKLTGGNSSTWHGSVHILLQCQWRIPSVPPLPPRHLPSFTHSLPFPPSLLLPLPPLLSPPLPSPPFFSELWQ